MTEKSEITLQVRIEDASLGKPISMKFNLDRAFLNEYHDDREEQREHVYEQLRSMAKDASITWRTEGRNRAGSDVRTGGSD